MARIKTYDKDLVITGKEKVIGSDIDGKTLNYEINDIRDYVRGTSDGFEQDNRRVIITTETAGSLNYDISDMIENDQFIWDEGAGAGEPKLTVLDTWLVIFRVPIQINFSNRARLFYDYHLLLNRGKGTYGINGEVNTSPNDFLRINQVEMESISSNEVLPPKVFSLSSIGDTIIPNVDVDGSTQSFNLNEERDYYFRVFERPSPVAANIPSDYKLYRFLGSNGVYGSGGASTAPSDYLLIERQETGNPPSGLKVINIQLGTTINTSTTPGDNILLAIQRSFRGILNIGTDDLYIFEVRRRQGNSVYKEKYYWCAGRMNNVAANASIDDFYLDFKDLIASRLQNPNSSIVDINYSTVSEPAEALNTSDTQVVVGSNKPYIAINNTDSSKLGYKLYEFTGAEGTYGVGGDSTAVNGDFEEITIDDDTDKYATLEDLEDVKQEILTEDNTYTGKITLQNLIKLVPITKPPNEEGMIFIDSADPTKIKVFLDGQIQNIDMTPA